MVVQLPRAWISLWRRARFANRHPAATAELVYRGRCRPPRSAGSLLRSRHKAAYRDAFLANPRCQFNDESRIAVAHGFCTAVDIGGARRALALAILVTGTILRVLQEFSARGEPSGRTHPDDTDAPFLPQRIILLSLSRCDDVERPDYLHFPTRFPASE